MRLSIQWKSGILIAALSAVGVLALTAFAVNELSDQLRAGEDASLKALRNQAESAMNAELDKAGAAALAIARNPRLSELFALGERQALADELAPVWKDLKAAGARQGQYHLAPATSFLRLHKPSKFGDDLSGFRNTVLKSNADGVTVRGLEEGRGGFGFRYVTPVQYEGAQVGTFEVGRSFDDAFVNQLRDITGDEWFIYRLAGSSGVSWEAGTGRLAGTSEHEAYLPTKADASALSARQLLIRRVEAADGRAFAAALMPVTDFAGATIGFLKVERDRSATVAAIRDARVGMILGGLAVLIALLLAAVWIGRYIGRPMAQVSTVLGAMARGEVPDELRDLPTSDDEMGDLAEALEELRAYLTEMSQAAGSLAAGGLSACV